MRRYLPVLPDDYINRNHCSHCKPCSQVAVKQFINNACQLKLQSGVICLFINYNIKVNRNRLEKHTGHHTQGLFVNTGAGMPEQAV